MTKKITLRSLKNMIKAVIFDLDGTLLYTLGDITSAVNKSLHRYNLPLHTEQEYRGMVGYGLKELINLAVGSNYKHKSLLENVYQTVLEEYRNDPVSTTVPYPGIPAMVQTLKSMNISLSILSNKEDSLVRLIVDKILSLHYFTVVRGQRPDVPAKPDPAAVYSIVKTMKVHNDECIFIGDSGADIQTARNAGLTALGVSWGYRDVDHLKKEGAAYVAFSPDDIVNFIKGE